MTVQRRYPQPLPDVRTEIHDGRVYADVETVATWLQQYARQYATHPGVPTPLAGHVVNALGGAALRLREGAVRRLLDAFTTQLNQGPPAVGGGK